MMKPPSLTTYNSTMNATHHHHLNASTSTRIDLSQAQQKINQKLGTKERIDLYWTSLTLFLEEKLSKREWDIILQLQLGHDFVPFHNFFVKSLFHNARYAHHIPISSKNNLSVKYGQPTARFTGKNRSLSSHLVSRGQVPGAMNQMQQVPGAGSSAQMYIQQNQQSSQQQQPIPQLSVTDSLLALHTQGLVNPEIKAIQAAGASLDLPDRETVALRMRSVAMDMDLSPEINNECVALLMQATQNYLKNLIAKCIQLKNNKLPKELLKMRILQDYKPKKGTFLVRRSPFSVQIRNVVHSYSHYTEEVPYLNNFTNKKMNNSRKRKRDEFEGHGDSDEEEDNSDNEGQLDENLMTQIVQQDSFVITPRDLLTTIQCCPFLLNDCEKIREKISMSNWDLF